ncbi:alpha/beta fold hydrolase [Dactylosporangium sp. AC04546]|uniref:alpha/beta fold hydrolase n=1 Tax=Dactylosporangium sp. AC04546 TaxID=2862460 RepID=UPI001EDF44EE|nr:alpha/beta fold hydrolase [Dactylosporangium sp. AC04546]WVK87307.1 alpha/beta fold hydrolase [Dactylosporangium sp. AC04546]
MVQTREQPRRGNLTGAVVLRGGGTRQLAAGAVRAGFGLLGRSWPGLAARLAERIWFTVPRSRSRAAGTPVPGRRLTVPLWDGHLVAESWGDGPVVYLVHGWGGRRADLTGLVPPLTAAGFRVVAFDGPAHGESGAGPMGAGRTTFDEFSTALAALADTAGPAHAVVAHSGGCVAVALALADGFPARRVAFVAPMADIHDTTHEFARRAGFGERVRVRLVARIESRVGRSMAAYAVPTIARGLDRPPLLLVHDRDDAEIGPKASADIARAWPGAETVTTAGLGHRRILRDPAVLDRISGFVAAEEH